MKRYLLLILASLGLASCGIHSYWDYTPPSLDNFDSCPYDVGRAQFCLLPAFYSSSSQGEIIFAIGNDTPRPMTIDSLDVTLTSGGDAPVVIPQNAVYAVWLFYRRAYDDDLPSCTRKTFQGLPSDFKIVQQDTNKHDLRISYRYPMDIPNVATELRIHLRLQLHVHGDIVRIDRSYTFTKQHKSYTWFLRDC